MNSNSRRKFLKTGLLVSIFGYAAAISSETRKKLFITPPEIEGPFYPITPHKDTDFDLTERKGSKAKADGHSIWIEGKVLDQNGIPIEDATVELWQANAAGRYNHPHDKNDAPIDPNFQGWAIVPSGKEGRFKFKTIIPGVYPASKDWYRPPHIHFKASKKGYIELITQMYFPGHPLNETDRLLQRKGIEQQELVIAKKINSNPSTFQFNIVLLEA